MKKKLKFFVKYIVPVLCLFVSLIMMGELDLIKKQISLEKNNKSFVLEDEIKLDHITGNSYSVEFNIEQGGIKKAYVADISADKNGNNSIIYKTLDTNLDNVKININDNRILEIDFAGLDFDKSIIPEIKDIKQFAIVVLDTTNEWTVSYFIIRPEINLADKKYNFTVKSENEIVEMEKDLTVDSMQQVLLDGDLINISTINERIKIFEEEHRYYFFNEPIEIELENGELFKSNPYIDMVYKIPSSQEIYDNIKAIYDDIFSTK